MTRQLFDIWATDDVHDAAYPQVWHVQLVGYVGYFPTKEDAEKYVAGVKAYRERWGTK